MNTELPQTKSSVLGKYWHWCMILGFLLASITFLTVYLQKPEYESTHLLEVNIDSLLRDEAQPDLSAVFFETKQAIENARMLIMQKNVLDRVLADPTLQTAPSLADPLVAERELSRRLKVSSGSTGNCIAISYRDTNAVMAANVCNAVTDSFFQVHENTEMKRAEDLIRWLAPTINQWRAKVQSQRDQIIEIAKSCDMQKVVTDKVNALPFAGESSEQFFAKQDYAQSCEILEKLNKRMALLKVNSSRAQLRSICIARPATARMEPPPLLRSALFSLLALCIPSCVVLLVDTARRAGI